MVVLKILYFDSSAILSWFLKQAGGDTVAEIFNCSVQNFCSLNISKTVYNEVDNKLTREIKNPLKRFKWISLLSIFLQIDDSPKSEARMIMWEDEIKKIHPMLNKPRNSQDTKIINELITYLEGFVGQSHPILISCDSRMNKICREMNYRVFNPRESTYENFLELIHN